MYFLIDKPQMELKLNSIIPVDNFTFNHLKSHRVEIDEVFWATDMRDYNYKCKLTSFDKRKEQAVIKILQIQTKTTQLKHVLIQAIPDKNYLDKLIELATLARFEKVILFESKFSPKFNLNLDRLHKISLQSALLAEFTRLPSLEVQTIENLITNPTIYTQSVVMHQSGQLLTEFLSGSNSNFFNQSKYIWVGAEGGWSTSEEELFNDLKFTKLSLAKGVIYPAWLAGSALKFGNLLIDYI